jgi:hypothetical protein
MSSTAARPIPDYRRFRPIFAVIVSLVWFLLLWGFGYLIAVQLPGEEPLPFRLAWRFFLVGFFPICLFAAPATFIGFLQQHLVGAFAPPPPSPARHLQATVSVNPWLLSLNRILLVWFPAVLLATLCLWLSFPDGISRGAMALVLALLGTPLAGIMAAASSGRPFLQELQVSSEQRAWQGSFLSYLFWRHGVPWGIGNGVISAILALAIFPRTASGEYSALPPVAVSVDIFSTSLVLCFFMAISAHPHAWVDTRLGIIRAPDDARSPARSGRIIRFIIASLGIALAVIAVLKVVGSDGLTVWQFVFWKGVAATVIAGAAAMITAYWTLAREKVAV